LPSLALQVEQMMNLGPLTWSDLSHAMPDQHAIKPYSHLMTRVEAAMLDKLFEPAADAAPTTDASATGIEALASEITIDDFAKIDSKSRATDRAGHVLWSLTFGH
jgi:methionyl-tRNA synthetase